MTDQRISKTMTGYYDAWRRLHEMILHERLAGEDHTEGGKLSCGVVRYSHLKNYILSGEPMPDIVIACHDDGELTDYARTMIRDYFAAHPDINLLYADEDRISDRGEYMDPWFKSDWAPDTFLSTFYFGNIFAVRSIVLSLLNPGSRRAMDIEARASLEADTAEEQMARRDEPDEALRRWIYGKLCMRIAQADGGYDRRQGEGFPIGHIPEVLFHGRERVIPWDSDLLEGSLTGRFNFQSASARLVSIILPSRDDPQVLRRCVESIAAHTRTPYELIIVDNGSSPENKALVQALVDEVNEKGTAYYVYEEMPFNMSAFYNLGARHANGEFLLFMHDDVVVSKNDWLALLSEKAKLPYVGCVGTKLLYPSSSIIQHAGILNVQGTPVYKLQYRPNRETWYFGFNKGVRNVTSVTGACLMVRTSVFNKVGGFDEENFGDCFSDVDFCLRVFEQGYYNVVRNNMYLYYHEASARTEEMRMERERLREQELVLLREKHPALCREDPYYHRYLTQNVKEARFILELGNLTV